MHIAMEVTVKLINRLGEGQIKKVFLSESKVEVTLGNEDVYTYGRREGQGVVPGDELDEFSKLCRSKWNKGREEYAGKGLPVYEADTVQEAQNELLDLGNFFAILYWELDRMKARFDIKPERRLENET